MKNIEEYKLRLELLKENFEYKDFFVKFIEWEKKAEEGVWPGLGFNEFGLFGLRFLLGLPSSLSSYRKALDLIDPCKATGSFSEEFVNKILPKLFIDPAVRLVLTDENKHLDEITPRGAPMGVSTSVKIISRKGVNPWDRIYMVDLRKKKTQILKEFEYYLDVAFLNHKELDLFQSKRKRDETKRHLEVWKLRKKRKPFPEIAKRLKITQEAAKKSFYRAYELTQNKKYDPDSFKKEIWLIKKTELNKTCDTCPQKTECTTLCPDVLRYIDQDRVYLHEKILSESSDSLRDHITQKQP